MSTYTEAEATERWCPQSMASSEAWDKCQGSACMAWRLAAQEYDEFYTLNGIRTEAGKVYSFEDNGRMQRQVVPLLRKGFCGLAGRPE